MGKEDLSGRPVTHSEVADAAAELLRKKLTPSKVTSAVLAEILKVSKCRSAAILQRMRWVADTPEKLTQLQEHRLVIENRELGSKLHQLALTTVANVRYQEFIDNIVSRPTSPPEWTTPTPKKGTKVVIPTAFLSDTHWDESVDPGQVNWVNGYDRPIATARLHNFFENIIKVCDNYLTGMEYPGLVLPLGGDLFSGNIHDELKETNEDALCGSMIYWLDPMIAGINLLKKRFGKLFIPVVVGNHPRMSKKPRAKGGVRDNFDWLFGQLIAREFSNDPDVTVQVSESFDLLYTLFNTRYLLTHGDQFRGGSGISAELSPLFIGDARKKSKQQAVGQPYDIMIMGHRHRLMFMDAPGIIVNGSVKGYDEYALRENFKFEYPKQAFWLTDPEEDVTIRMPIHVLSKNEPWMERSRLGDKSKRKSIWPFENCIGK